jgi:hypothetical protein
MPFITKLPKNQVKYNLLGAILDSKQDNVRQ